ncbi:MAG: hypothetical protein M1574_06015 [Gammaproteobacteria bacterium]|jgi:hypothetical protein|nr:hypothetical protein [Gammaproteobacteria bacterium]
MQKKLPDRCLFGLIVGSLLHGSVAVLPGRPTAPPSAPPPRRLRINSPRPPLTLSRLSALESAILRLRYEVAIAKLRHQLAALQPRPRSPLPLSTVRTVLQIRKPVVPRSPTWRVVAILGRGRTLKAVLATGAGRETVEAGSRLGASRIVHVAPNAVWIKRAGTLRRLPVVICGRRIGCRRPKRSQP